MARCGRIPVSLRFPLAVALAVCLMTALGISGSSAAMYSADIGTEPSLLALNPRFIRSDEWVIRTPLVLGQANSGFPSNRFVGVGDHDMTVLNGLPTHDWSAVFKPQTWGYLVLPAENGFAFEWWISGALLVLGAYWLLLVITGDPWWSVVGSLLLGASPFLHWWYFRSRSRASGSPWRR